MPMTAIASQSIQFLRAARVDIARIVYCGDGCCSWVEIEREKMVSEDIMEVSNWQGITESSFEDLIEGVDFKILE
jgi:hypothetical protein